MPSTFNLKFLEEISAGDQQKLKHLMQTFIDEAPKALNKLKDLQKVRNFDDMYQVVHTAKPLYHSVGSEKATAIIGNLENYSRSAFFRELIPVEIQELDKISSEICQEMSTLMQTKFNN